jgi:hypothetical protein
MMPESSVLLLVAGVEKNDVSNKGNIGSTIGMGFYFACRPRVGCFYIIC